MKKLIALVALLMITLNVNPLFAQESKANRLTMKEGKMWIVSDGSTTPMTQDINLSDGKTVKTDGTVIMADGSATKLTEGQSVKMDGTIEKPSTKK